MGLVSVIEKDQGWKAFERLLHQLAKGETYVKAGVIGAKGDAQHQGEAITVARLAAVHEFGVRIGNIGIPERSFIRSTWAAKSAGYYQTLHRGLQSVAERRMRPGQFPRFLRTIGLQMVADMQETIRAGIAPPLAASTLARRAKPTRRSKASQGSPAAVPLLDTGQLINSLSSQVVIGGDE